MSDGITKKLQDVSIIAITKLPLFVYLSTWMEYAALTSINTLKCRKRIDDEPCAKLCKMCYFLFFSPPINSNHKRFLTHGVLYRKTVLVAFYAAYLRDPLEEGMANHFSIPALRTPWTAAAAAKSLQPCPTLCDPVDGSPPGSPVPGTLQARTLEWAAISFSSAWKWKVKAK